MKNEFVCHDCLSNDAGKAVEDLTAEEFAQFAQPFKSRKKCSCPKCGSDNVHKFYSLGTVYQSGYGFMDKRGVRNDMDLHAMTKGTDPYAEHRDKADKDRVIKHLKDKQKVDKKTKKFSM